MRKLTLGAILYSEEFTAPSYIIGQSISIDFLLGWAVLVQDNRSIFDIGSVLPPVLPRYPSYTTQTSERREYLC
jgi:hypothetical protein